MKFGEKLQHLRKANGYSQEQLAQQMTVSRQAVSKWELGESMPDTDNIIQLTKLFGVTTDYLLIEDYDIDIVRKPTVGSAKSTLVQKRALKVSAWILLLSSALCLIAVALLFLAPLNGLSAFLSPAEVQEIAMIKENRFAQMIFYLTIFILFALGLILLNYYKIRDRFAKTK